ncbi:MAG TPA: TIGR02996 domain-containing protein [Caulobacteraceae bacterium]|nr:TIGR02996 domain-containing protein [Caulobacteraceae bacterium]
MGEGEQLLAAILAAPADDRPRRAYADWLTRRGDPRGEFITLQLRDGDNHADWRARDAAEAIRQEHGADWVPPIKGLTVIAFRRGFPELVAMTGEDFLAGAAELFRTLPVRGLLLHRCGGSLGRIAAFPQLANLRALDLGDGADSAGLAALASSPWVGGLERLELARSPIGDAGAAALGAATGLTRLTTLNLTGCGIGPDGIGRLASSPTLRRLTDLLLGRNPLGPGVAALAASPQLGPLERLYLHACDVDDEGAAALAASKRLSRLEELVLEANLIHDAGAAAFADSEGLTNLVRLKLAENAIGDAGAAAFAASTRLPRLAMLDLSSNIIGEAGAEALAGSRGLPALQTLGLTHNPIYAEGRTEDWVDYNGAVVGSGPVKLDVNELNARYGRRFKIS